MRTVTSVAVLNDAPVFTDVGCWYAADPFQKLVFEMAARIKINLLSPVTPFSHGDQKGVFVVAHRENLSLYHTRAARSIIGFYCRWPYLLICNIRSFLGALRTSDVLFLRMCTPNAMLIFPLALFFRKPVVTLFPGNPLEIVASGNKYKGLMKPLALIGGKVHMDLLKAIAKRSTVALMLSEQLYKLLSCTHDNSTVFYTSLIDKQAIRSTIDPVGNPIKMLYAGRLSHEKGLGDLIQAVRLLLDSGTVIELTICGDGPDRYKLEALCKALGLKKHIVFRGFIPPGDDLVDVFRGHDIFVHPSYSEGFPKVIWEAMAQGLPVITTPVGSIPDVIDNGLNGLFVQCRQPQKIHDAVLRVIGDERLRVRLIENGYYLVRQNTIQVKADQLIRYFSLSATPGNPR